MALFAGALWLLFGTSGDPDPDAAGTSPDPQPASTPPTTAAASGWTVTLSDQVGGLDLVFRGGSEVPHRQDALVAAGVGVRDLVGGRYQDPADPSVAIDFHGGELTEPLAGPQLASSGQQLLGTALDASFGNLSPVAPIQQYDAGPLGGEVWCAAYHGEARACGWIDEATIGIAFSATGLTEADVAELLVTMRPDLQTIG